MTETARRHPTGTPPSTTDAKAAALRTWMASRRSLVVAYSGGVDSALVATFAHDVLGDSAVAVTAESESYPEQHRVMALDVASAIGFRHEFIRTHELDRPEYRANPTNRCYYCKHELFGCLTRLARDRGIDAVADGSNADDRGDYRPGREAAREFGVCSPLDELGFTKADIRAVAQARGIPTWAEPASACLSSRIPYFSDVTPEKLRTIEQAERVLRDLARQGHKLIFATSFGYLEPALRVGAEFPSVAFEQTGGYKTSANVNTYNARYYEARYLAGLLAGKTSKSGVAGYVAGFPVPEVIQGINAFTLGMRAVNPKASVKVVWLDTWFDPARERDAANALVNQGADILTNHSASSAVAQVAEERRVGLIAYQSDMRKFAPHAQLTAITHEWGGYYTRVAQQVLDGTWHVAPVWGGMKDGFVRLAPFGDRVPKDVAAFVAQRQAELIAGRLHPFGGRIVDSGGRVRQADGTMADARIESMDYLVEGVVGTLPARR